MASLQPMQAARKRRKEAIRSLIQHLSKRPRSQMNAKRGDGAAGRQPASRFKWRNFISLVHCKILYTVKRSTTFVNYLCSLSETHKSSFHFSCNTQGGHVSLCGANDEDPGSLSDGVLKNVAAKGRMTITVECNSIIIVHGKAPLFLLGGLVNEL